MAIKCTLFCSFVQWYENQEFAVVHVHTLLTVHCAVQSDFVYVRSYAQRVYAVNSVKLAQFQVPDDATAQNYRQEMNSFLSWNVLLSISMSLLSHWFRPSFFVRRSSWSCWVADRRSAESGHIVHSIMVLCRRKINPESGKRERRTTLAFRFGEVKQWVRWSIKVKSILLHYYICKFRPIWNLYKCIWFRILIAVSMHCVIQCSDEVATALIHYCTL